LIYGLVVRGDCDGASDAGIGEGNPHLDSGGFFGCYAVK
jgi:hypothetical protein